MAGGAAGALLRARLVAAVTHLAVGHCFPWGTLLVNTAGALAMGLLLAVTDGTGQSGLAGLLFGVGLLGSFTTVSAWALESLRLEQDGARGLALVNILATLILCLGAVVAGYGIGMGVVPGVGSGG